MKVLVVDYKSGGNLFSLINSLEHLNISYKVSSDPKDIDLASKVIFPGVGGFAAATKKLDDLGLKQALINAVERDIAFLGICVGMQLMFKDSTESTQNKTAIGLGLIPGNIEKLAEKTNCKIPHMGWNQVKISSEQNPLFKRIADNTDFYFVHSYAYKLNSQEQILNKYPQAEFSTCNHSEEFLASFWNGKNFFTTQFHPEKSAEQGLQILKNFRDLNL